MVYKQLHIFPVTGHNAIIALQMYEERQDVVHIIDCANALIGYEIKTI
jgi:hypothetical protein